MIALKHCFLYALLFLKNPNLMEVLIIHKQTEPESPAGQGVQRERGIEQGLGLGSLKLGL